jgi:HSP20 family molecular chaperone IbpA|eukprot:gene1420-9030_t
MEEEGWEWPEEKPAGSNYYNSRMGGSEPPPPQLLQSERVAEEEDVSKRITQVRNYSWSDDTDFIRIYVPIPGVKRGGVEVEFAEDQVDLVAVTPEYGKFTMSILRLFDTVQPHLSSFKVLERKEKVIIALAKVPPPKLGDDAYVNYKQWYRLHHGGTANIDILDDFEDARLKRGIRMNQPSKPPPIPSATVRRPPS